MRAQTVPRKENPMETAAAILTQLLYTSEAFSSSLESQGTFPGKSGQGPAERLASEVKPYYEAMLKMVREASAKK
jgi:hypothetical protein